MASSLPSCSSGSASRKRRNTHDHTTPKPDKKKVRAAMVCSLKQCATPQGVIDPQQQCHVEITAALPATELGTFLQQTAVSWSASGEAVFHEHCWARLLREARRRNPKHATLQMSHIEKKLVKDAAKTLEQHDSAAAVSVASSRIAMLMRAAKHCVVFTGAGISTSAGIGDYRGKAGKWTQMDREAVTKEVGSLLGGACPDTGDGRGGDAGGETGDAGVPYEDLRPTYTHEALVKLMQEGIVKYVISQNGDGLHGLSGMDYHLLAELHGNVFLEKCEKCGEGYYRPYYVLDDQASQYYEELEDNGHTDLSKPPHAAKCKHCGLNHRTGRRCAACNGFLKDSIINFGDDLEESILSGAEEQAKRADLILSLGTTMRVTPACDLVLLGRKPLQLVIVNRQHTGFDGLCGREGEGVRVFGDCDQVMREVMQCLLPDGERQQWQASRHKRMEIYKQLRT